MSSASVDTPIEDIEKAIQERNLTAPRVTPQDINDLAIAGQTFVFPGTTVTVCCLTLRNGFNVVGHSACASPENFDEEIGRQLALEDAKRQIWTLEGYALKDRMHRESVAAGTHLTSGSVEGKTA